MEGTPQHLGSSTWRNAGWGDRGHVINRKRHHYRIATTLHPLRCPGIQTAEAGVGWLISFDGQQIALLVSGEEKATRDLWLQKINLN
ncbi:hypothetical protein CDAR_518081 [Caerostris darwini]|uniref:Uncharacterized protein n=1 Tax=Caerostris darwini TaxID=1538125 RepID=A0AAV4VJM6_9ARAC|nr:hypothetical protein CDAR_518081 [Caerostris darwini]